MRRKILIFSLLVLFITLGASTETGKKSDRPTLRKIAQEGGDFFVFNINNLYMPMDYTGVIADVDPADGIGPGGQFDNNVFLFSAGFFVSGYTDSILWANGVLSASRIQDYQQGPFGSNKNNPENKIYVVSQQDPAFGDSWQEWSSAVSIGADFYDGDGDGIYNPIDKNGNGKWDLEEDRPDILGDVTAWNVINDGVPSALRRYNVNPQGIEIRQSVFGFKSKSIVGNMMFVRYRIVNTGAVADTLKDLYFSAAADPDLGDYADDLVGCDINLSAGYVYNNGSDADFGENPPSFMLDFFQGPVKYTGNPADTAYNVRGPQIGVDTLVGYVNLPLSSMTQYMQSHPTHGDPNTHNELRNYMLGGLDKDGNPITVAGWTFGNGATLGAEANSIDPKFMYSGDPETGSGWLNIEPIDQRIMCNTGSFDLAAGEFQDIIVAYVVGRGTDALNSVTVTKEIDETAQIIFANNFPAPAPPPPLAYTVETGDGFIDITWPTADHINYVAKDTILFVEKKFEGFFLTAYKTNSKELTKNGTLNAKELVTYDLDNFIEDIYIKTKDGNVSLMRAASDNKLDSLLYGNPETGRLRLRITKDPFTDLPLIPGSEYYFSIGEWVLNHTPIVNRATGNYGDPGDILDETNAAYEEYETSIIRVVYGDDTYDQALSGASGTQTGGKSAGEVKYVVVDKAALTGDEYSVEFFQDKKSTDYSVFWRLKNDTKGTVLVDSSKNFDFTDNIAGKVYEGMIAKVKPLTPELLSIDAQAPNYISDATDKWYSDFIRTANFSGAYYVGADISASGYDADFNPVSNPLLPAARSTAISAADLKKVELRFGDNGKAYRYLNGYEGRRIGRRTTYVYAEAVSRKDTILSGPLGLFDDAANHAMGFVDVPFSAYAIQTDAAGKEVETRLAVAFLERSGQAFYGSGNPDGNWDPGYVISNTLETIIIFNSEYDANGGHQLYKGGFISDAGDTVWADLINGYKIPANIGASKEDSMIAASPWFDALYTVNLQRDSSSTGFFQAGDKFVIEAKTYPYTSNDKFAFNTITGGKLTSAQEEALFDKVNVFPNPLFAFNPQTSYNSNLVPDDPFVTFTHIPEDATVRIYTLSGTLIRTLTSADKSSAGSQFLQWDLKNEDRLRAASGLYIALVDSPKYGQKVLKFSIILPQKQLQRY